MEKEEKEEPDKIEKGCRIVIPLLKILAGAYLIASVIGCLALITSGDSRKATEEWRTYSAVYGLSLIPIGGIVCILLWAFSLVLACLNEIRKRK